MIPHKMRRIQCFHIYLQRYLVRNEASAKKDFIKGLFLYKEEFIIEQTYVT